MKPLDVTSAARRSSRRYRIACRHPQWSGALLLSAALVMGEAGAVDRYVDPIGGVDAVGCDVDLSPCQTIEHAIDESGVGDTINLISLAGAPTVFFESALEIPFDLTIRGEGAFRTEIDAQGLGRLFTITGGAQATIDRITLRNGAAADEGGAIRLEDGELLLYRSRLLDSQALAGGGIAAPSTAGRVVVVASSIHGGLGTGGGGGIWCDGCGGVTVVLGALDGNLAGGPGGAVHAFGATVTLQSSRVTRNEADAGGGVYAANTSGLNVLDSELADNVADSGDGGGILVGGTLNLQRSTFADNTAPTGNGGAVYAAGNSLLLGSNLTFSGNEAMAGGALALPSNFGVGPVVAIGTSTFHGNLSSFPSAAEHISGDWNAFVLHNSIVTADPTAGGALDPFCTRALDFGSNNLVDDASCDSGGATFNLGTVTDLDPLLAYNGGLGRTHLPGPTSNAIEAGNNAACLNPASGNALVFDQRRRTRPVDADASGVAECDIGAVERQ